MARSGEMTRAVVTFEGDASGLQRAGALGRGVMRDLSQSATDGAAQMSAAWANAATQGLGAFQAKAKGLSAELKADAEARKASMKELLDLEGRGAMTAAGRGFSTQELDEYLRRVRELNFAQKEFAEVSSKPTVMAGTLLEYAQRVEGARAMVLGFKSANEEATEGLQMQATTTRQAMTAQLELIAAEERAAALARSAGRDPEKAVAAVQLLSRSKQELAAATALVMAGDQSAVPKIKELTRAVQEQQIALGEATNQSGTLSNKFGQMSMQMVMGIDDFMTMYQATGKLSDGLRGAGNNITAMMMPLGTMPTLLATIGTAAAFGFAKYVEGSKDAQEATEKNIERMKELLKLSREEGFSKRQIEGQQDMQAIVELKAAIGKAERGKESPFSIQEARLAEGEDGVKRYRERVRQLLRGEAGAGAVKIGNESIDYNAAENRLREIERAAKVKQAEMLSQELKKVFKDSATDEAIKFSLTDRGMTLEQAGKDLSNRISEIKGLDPRFTAKPGEGIMSPAEQVALEAQKRVGLEIASKQFADKVSADREEKRRIDELKSAARGMAAAEKEAERAAKAPSSERGAQIGEEERQRIDAMKAQTEAIHQMVTKLEEDLQERARAREETLQAAPLPPIEPANLRP